MDLQPILQTWMKSVELKTFDKCLETKVLQYDADDRLKGRQGEVAFMAYVSREGSLGQFKMLKSSGYRELDEKL